MGIKPAPSPSYITELKSMLEAIRQDIVAIQQAVDTLSSEVGAVKAQGEEARRRFVTLENYTLQVRDTVNPQV